ncbi:helix-turn-helix domain protein [Ruminococcus sp. CAG:177]|nr:helix-turn-helix domain protein [Ruminococcus sp. CAG:177]
MNFPGKLQKLRKERGWSQEELASRIAVSRQAVSKWELGTAVPDTDNIVQLSKLFGVTTDYLIKDNLDCDEDIPAVARTAANVRKLLIAGIVTLVLGVIIIGVLLTLSQVIESYQKVTYDHGPMMEILPDGTTQISSEHRMATTRVPVYSFVPFLNTYYLHWVLVIGLGLVTASVVCFAKYRRKIKAKKKL